MASTNPQVCTVSGRLSWPNLTMDQAIVQNGKSKFPKAPEKIAPSFSVLVEQSQVDKIIEHAETVFLPWCVAQGLAGETRSALTQKEADKILAFLKDQDWEAAPPHTPLKAVSDKTQPMAPTAVASIKVEGRPGVNITQSAHARTEADLAQGVEIAALPAIVPIGQTVYELYPGCNVAVTLNMYAFVASKMPGYTASATTVVFKGDNDRFGGGSDVDEDEIFLDD